MIIRRKYCTYGQLMADEDTKKLLISILEKYEQPDRAEWLMDANHNIIVCNTGMGSCIPGEAFHEIYNELEKLDCEKPFDNGLSFDGIRTIIPYSNEDGNGIMQIMVYQKYDMEPLIAQVVAFEYGDDNKIHLIEPWDIGEISL